MGDAMMSEMCNRLLGKKTKGPSNRGEAKVWLDAAQFFNNRIQASSGECPGRSPDMSDYAARAMRKVLPQIAGLLIEAPNQEAAQLLMYNRERVVEDITNPHTVNIDGKRLTQVYRVSADPISQSCFSGVSLPDQSTPSTGLKRVDRKHQASVDAMINELCCCLLGRPSSKKLSPEDAMVWAQAAAFLAGRVQGTASDCPGRSPDMSSAAATALRTMLSRMEAAHMLMNNRERVVQDITNPGPKNIDGKALTQTDLKRLDIKHQASVNAMIKEVSCRLFGKTSSTPPPQEVLVWAEAA